MRRWFHNNQPRDEFTCPDVGEHLRKIEEGRPPSLALLKALRRYWREAVEGRQLELL